MGCAPSSRAASSCLVKRPLPITLLPFLPPSSASRRSRSPEVGQRRGSGWGGAGASCRQWAGVSAAFCLPGSKEATTMLHMLTLLKDLLPCFPEGLVKSCSETLLRVMTLNHVVSSSPSAWGTLRRREGRASDPRPVCWHSGGSLFRPKVGVGVSWPRPCSWLHPRTHLIPGVGQTGQPQLGDELREGVESGGTGEAAVLPCLSSAPPTLMVIFFSLSPSSFAYSVRSV